MKKMIFTLFCSMTFMFMLNATNANVYNRPTQKRVEPVVTKDLKVDNSAFVHNNLMSGNILNQLFVTELSMEAGVFRSENISSNGKYLVGYSTKGAFLWDLENSVAENFAIQHIISSELASQGLIGNAYDVTDDAVVLGQFYDENLDAENYIPGVWKNGIWTSLGLALINPGRSDIPETNAITNDGKMVVGGTYAGADFIMRPYVWTSEDGSTWNGSTWEPTNGTNAKIKSVSKDGSVAAGWGIRSQGGKKLPLIFTSSTDFQIIGGNSEIIGECNKVSDNGKFIAMTYNNSAAIYDVENDKIITIKNNAVCTDVSNNGVAIGYYNLTTNPTNSPRKGFVWSEEMGFLDFFNYLSTYAKDVTVPTDIDFRPSYGSIDVPTCISPDGRIISGWTGISQFQPRTFVLILANDLVVYQRPQNFTASVNLYARTKVNLTWDSPKIEEGKILTGYNIYRNDEFIAHVANNIKYYEDDVTDYFYYGGEISYFISATYEGDIETPKTDAVSVRIVDNYDIPFIDDFEYEDITANYWTITTPKSSGLWYIDYFYPQGFKGFCASFWLTGAGVQYSESFVSKPFDATKLNEIYLSFLNTNIPQEIIENATDTFYVELLPDVTTTEWKVLKKYPLENPEGFANSGKWSFEEFDLSSDVAGNIFQIRFRVSGNSDKTIYIEIDNFQVRSTKEETAPQNLKATKNAEENKVYLTWSTPSNSSHLTYLDNTPIQTIGNEGVSFIGANLFDIEDLDEYKNQYLTSVYAFFPKSYDIPAVMKLVVFEGTERICDQEILYTEPTEWNSIHLNEPILIKGDKPLYIGIEVVEHNKEDMPLYTGKASSNHDGKGNLFSEDGGETWKKLSDFGLKNYWCFIGNVTKTNNQFDDFENIWGYEVLRNGVNVLDTIMIFPLKFVDEIEEGENPCYTVRAYYANTAWSAQSEEACITTVSIDNTSENSSFVIYPNPVINEFKVSGFEGEAKLTVLDLSGRALYTKTVKEFDTVSIKKFETGLYILKLSLPDKTVREAKILKKQY